MTRGLTLRALLGALGVAAAAYGAVLLLEEGWSDVVATAVWLGSGVIAHDLVLAPVVIGLLLLGAVLVPTRWRAAAAGGFLVLGTVTLTAVPVLGRFGARPDNPTLLDRNYWGGWLVFAGLVLLGVLVAGLVRPRQQPPRGG